MKRLMLKYKDTAVCVDIEEVFIDNDMVKAKFETTYGQLTDVVVYNPNYTDNECKLTSEEFYQILKKTYISKIEYYKKYGGDWVVVVDAYKIMVDYPKKEDKQLNFLGLKKNQIIAYNSGLYIVLGVEQRNDESTNFMDKLVLLVREIMFKGNELIYGEGTFIFTDHAFVKLHHVIDSWETELTSIESYHI